MMRRVDSVRKIESVRKLEPKNLPMKKFRAGAVSATIWDNQGKNLQGQAVNYKTVSFERHYKDAAGEWQTTSSLRMTDLPKATLVLNKAYEFLAMNDEEE